MVCYGFTFYEWQWDEEVPGFAGFGQEMKVGVLLVTQYRGADFVRYRSLFSVAKGTSALI